MNVSIAIYNATTGELDRVCSVSESDVPLQVRDEESFILIEDEAVISDMYRGNYKKYRVANGAIVALPPQPSQSHLFDYALEQWVDVRSLDDVKRERWESIKSQREQVINAKLDTPYGAVDGGERDRVNITNSVMMLQTLAGLGTPGTVQFTMADNSTAELDTSKMVHIGLLLGQKIEAAHATARALRQAIDEAQTIEEVLAITWS